MQRRYKNGILHFKMWCSIAAKREENNLGRNLLPNVEEIDETDAGGYKYLGLLELDQMCDKMKRKFKEVYQKRITLLVKTHLNGKNLFLALTTSAISVKRYIAVFLD